MSLKELIPDMVRDQKPIWLFPSRLAQGKHLKPFLLVAGVTAGLVALDQVDEPYFRNTAAFDKFKTGPVRGRNMTLVIVAAPLTMYLSGQFTGDNYAKQSGLFATEALGDAMVADFALKSVFGRLHPSDIPTHGDFTHSWFKYPAPLSSNPGSFPSGHSAMAFAVASVLSRRYHRHQWVPWVVYGAATIVALTRIPDQAHFASDVFAGAALGYAIGHFIPIPQTGESR
jgi:membrane-associated phospholipid phosphatase